MVISRRHGGFIYSGTTDENVPMQVTVWNDALAEKIVDTVRFVTS